jgi:uncharacterized protein YeeX (DUF496 family)
VKISGDIEKMQAGYKDKLDYFISRGGAELAKNKIFSSACSAPPREKTIK